jgi:hypothetical protein
LSRKNIDEGFQVEATNNQDQGPPFVNRDNGEGILELTGYDSE